MAIEMEVQPDGSARMTLTDEDADYAEYLKVLVTKARFSKTTQPIKDSLRIIEWLTEEGPGIELAAVATDADDKPYVAFIYPDRPAQRPQIGGGNASPARKPPYGRLSPF